MYLDWNYRQKIKLDSKYLEKVLNLFLEVSYFLLLEFQRDDF